MNNYEIMYPDGRTENRKMDYLMANDLALNDLTIDSIFDYENCELLLETVYYIKEPVHFNGLFCDRTLYACTCYTETLVRARQYLKEGKNVEVYKERDTGFKKTAIKIEI